MRKVIKDTPREIEKVCGNCWDWDKWPNPGLTPEKIDRKTYVPKYN
jgi:hypothetical protein